ncbi:MAG TPA: amidohydrolase family protein [Phycisphaerae bacterium]|nr:amidohydrolase family protein [Phycisphaerae bacterium]
MSPDNRLGLDYRKPPARKFLPPNGIIDAHNHAGDPAFTQHMVDAALAYGITEFYTMAPLEQVPALKEKFPNRFRFIAVPGWTRDMPTPDASFFADWHKRIETFREHGAGLIKFHAAPGTCRRWGITLDDPRIQEIARHAYDLGYHFMTHVGDPNAWFYGKGPYSDGTGGGYGTPASQFAMLERMLDKYPDRLHLGAHMGGSLENLDALACRLEKFPHYILDSSATRWMVRAVAEQSTNAVRDFIIAFQDRILFGSDNVALQGGGDRSFDHFASRYWAHQMLWESDYNGESNIDDPDAGKGFNPKTGEFDPAKADNTPRLKGLNLPAEVLQKLYRGNAERLLPH